MTPNITTLPKIHLIGQNIKTSFANDETVELWRSFMSRKKEVRHQKDDNLYSVEIYPNSSFFDAFDPTKTFEKWAAISVSKIEEIPMPENIKKHYQSYTRADNSKVNKFVNVDWSTIEQYVEKF